MKIGLVLDDTLDTPDGIQQYVIQVGAWLTERGHEVHYLVGETKRTDIPNVHSLSKNLKVKFNGNTMSMSLLASTRKLKVFLKKENFDILHVQTPYSPFLAGKLIRLASPTTAVVGTFHILPYGSLARLATKAQGYINYSSVKRFDKMIAVSEPAQRFARSTHAFKGSIDVVPNPVRLDQFKGAASKDEHLNIVFLGRLVARKGAMQLLQAVAYMYENGLFSGEFRLVIGGKGPLLPELARFSKEHSISDRVVFPGFLDESEKAEFLARADLAVFPSIAGESFGIVLLEAMAAARGVVLAGDNPGYASVMSPYPDQLFNPMDTKAFAEKLAWYLDHELARSRASEMQHQYVQHFDTKVVGNELELIYQRALQTRRNS